MAFLDNKNTILDVILTDKGKELLSSGDLKIKYYAFSDSGVDYSGSAVFTSSLSNTSFDDFVFRSSNLECIDMQGKDSQESRTLPTFLYTVSTNDKTLPQLKLNVSSSITLKRQFTIIPPENLPNAIKNPYLLNKKLILRITSDQQVADRNSDYVNEQLIKKIGIK